MMRCSLWPVCYLTIILLLSACRESVAPSEGRTRQGQNRESAPNSFSGQQLRALGVIEANEAERNRVTWANEILSRRYDRVVSDFWDRLKASEAALSVVAEFPFQSIEFGQSTDQRNLQHGIQHSRLDGNVIRRRSEQWRSLISQWVSAGWVMEFQECRQSAFDLSEPSAPRSVFELNVHLKRASPLVRGILRGKLSVVWEDGTVGEIPRAKSIELIEGEWLTRSGPPVFKEIVSREMMPHTETRFIDPLIVADFDGNGRSDLLFSGCNVLYSGIEGGGLRSEPFVNGSNPVVYTSIYADINGDGLRDYVFADRQGVMMVPGGGDRRRLHSVWKAPDQLLNPSALTAGDVDGDGDLDLWLVQYKMPYVAGQMPTPFYDANDGFPSYLLMNDGLAQFSDRTIESGLGGKRNRRTYSASLIDLDGDQDLDLLNVSDFAGLDVYRNDGEGRFVEATSAFVDVANGFGMAHTFGDFDRNGSIDFMMIGMNSAVADRLDSLSLWPEDSNLKQHYRSLMAYGNRMYFNQGGRFVEAELGKGAARAGWAWGVGTLDFDNDGDIDLYIANGHKTRASTRDYDEQFWCHDLFTGNSNENPVLDLYFRKVGTELYGEGYSYGGHQRNAFFLNVKGNGFVEVAYLLGLADDADGRNVVCEDLDNDGLVDIVITTSEVWPKSSQSFRLYQNLLEETGNWIGLQVPPKSPGGSWLGAKVSARHGDQSIVKVITSGDGYRTQSAGNLHFGLGKLTSIDQVTVRFPDGEQFELDDPELGRYHALTP
jgi:enediyne biosynthesis protein E4